MNEVIDADIMPPDINVAGNMAVGKPLPHTDAAKAPMTAAQAKVEAIASLTMTAYAKAGELKLTEDEIVRLRADFPDEAFKPGAAGKEHLIYIEHAYLRDRLNDVIGPGAWAIVPRSRWNEPFKTEKGKDGNRVYVEAMLIVRGCFVAEAVGEMEYYPHNASQNFGDAVEGAKSACLRRCCKEFGIGLQAWKKDWCDGWWQRRRAAMTGKGATRPVTPQPPQPAAPAPAPAPAPKTEDRELAAVAKSWKDYMFAVIKKADAAIWAWEQAVADGMIMPNEPLENISDAAVIKNKKAFEDWWASVLALKEKGVSQELQERFDAAHLPAVPDKPAAPAPPPAAKKEISVPRDPNSDPNAPDATWRSFPMPFGKEAGTKLADLDKKYLYGMWANFKVEETWVNNKGERIKTKPSKLATDKQLRAMLDEAGKHYDFTLPGESQPGEPGKLPIDDDVPF